MSTIIDPKKPHDHAFGQERRRPAESRTWWVVSLTVVTMVFEIMAGVATGSMALLADGLHMGSHAIALGINALAYWYARREAFNPDFSFGTGKVNALGGYTGALMLGVFGIVMAWESFHRILNPHVISFDLAITVAVVGLIVNGASVLILGGGHSHQDHHAHTHSHHGGHTHSHSQRHSQRHSQSQPHDHTHRDSHSKTQDNKQDHSRAATNSEGTEGDHNLKSAYLHVLTDALTSVLAILALVAGKFAGLNWLDPLMGILGAILIVRWSLQLVREASATLLDKQVPVDLQDQVRAALERDSQDRVTDLHLWSVGPGLLAAEIVILTTTDAGASEFRRRLPGEVGLVHATIEVHYEQPPDAQDGSQREL